jgi:phosphomannomutase
MVTASHNPPQDNGYKVYLGDGAQISPPADAEIAACIDAVGPLRDVPLGPAPERVDLANAYVDAVVGMVPGLTGAGGVPRDGLRIVYTPLHGVGRDLLLGAFARAGLPRPTVVAEQAAPDPDFPTVRRPNPEEPGTLDLALATAARERADVMIANDPDADRLAVAVPADGRWRVLTGDEVGALLAEYLLAGVGSPDGVVLVTTVASSTLLEQIAADAGVAFRRSLTGFKWIMRAAAEAAPRTLLLGYEEALGYAVGDLVHDKDGISAALTLTAAALRARADGTSLAGRLDALARRYGLYATRQVALELEGPDALTRMTATMDRLRTDTPELLLGRPVRSVEDLRPASDVLVLGGADGTRVVIRPSGTEPKLKIYLQVVVAVAGGEVGPARERARRDLDALADELEEVVSL